MITVFSSRSLSPSIVFLSLSRKYGSMLDVVAVDQVEVEDAGFASTVVRRRVESLVRSALRIRAARRIAARLERDDARHVGLEREHLEVEHQLHVLLERIRNAGRRFGELARSRRSCCALRPPECGARARGCPRDTCRRARRSAAPSSRLRPATSPVIQSRML